ncbi:FecR domain-containing protein [Paenibacillus typhae]|uniref:FecR domain-containing protein n=1 Tax=Paenibacillus typhae TaxID=1174501 RepID=UPI001C8D45DD|nr:FecR domain-containing protein [Paenibacillus typhae]MBY0010853.1 FecR domain-containing protein [Paenibacillus typhae]
MNKSLRILILFLSFLVLTGNIFSPSVFAAETDSAYITSLSGEVKVKLAGGARTISAFRNMPISAGDQIITGDTGNVTLTVSKPESVRTIGPDARVTLSSRSSVSGSKHLSFKLWTGSMWSSENSAQAGEGPVVETPGSAIKAQGTNFLVTVEANGTMSVFVASGLVTASFAGQSSGASVLVAPTQQLQVNPVQLPKQIYNAINIVDISELAAAASPSILKAIITAAPDILAENKELAQKLQASISKNTQPVIQIDQVKSDIYLNSLDDLQAYTANINHLISNIAYEAVQASKISSAEMEQITASVNKQISGPAEPLRYTDVTPLQPLAGVNPSAIAAKHTEQERLDSYTKALEQKQLQLQSDYKAKLNTTVQQISDLAKALENANQSLLQELNNKAEQAYTAQLTPAEQAAFEKNKQTQIPQTPVTSTTPVTTVPEQPSKPATSPEISISRSKTADGLSLGIHLKNFTGTNALYAAEFHFISEPSLKADNSGSRLLNNAYFDVKNSTDIVKTVTGTLENSSAKKTETIYAMTQFGVASNVEITDGNLAVIPFTVTGNGTVKLVYVKIVDSKGKTVLELSGDDAGLPPVITYSK